ncbi:DUF1028 domain-containing protein [Tumebacillus flagellatus]|uniref:Putative peptidoglycan binding domain-containing protein n=1 Tax=Tumebacillus flagellatus TaxID=1157490 RepID=A0A074LUU2_9BACL|nr:DUF1028 domain-containing protein [Tumebacillus flagellatus]KEO83688.1 hypothetical protein EL26_08520 [Tumebacillus flagellatus]
MIIVPNNRLVHTFSIVACDPKTGEMGVAVASKFLAVGSIVPWAQANVGAIATQSWANTGFGPDGLRMLSEGKTAQETLEALIKDDPGYRQRQLGIVDKHGNAAAYTGVDCHDWAGQVTGEGYSCQGNLLTGPEVVDAMSIAFQYAKGDLADRLLTALVAGDEAGGDKRGRQGAALYVVKEKGSYDGFIDRYVDLRVDDNEHPIRELKRLLGLHRLYLGETDPNKLRPIAGDTLQELVTHLIRFDYLPTGEYSSYTEQVKKALHDYCAVENFDTRWREDDQIDEEILVFMRGK